MRILARYAILGFACEMQLKPLNGVPEQIPFFHLLLLLSGHYLLQYNASHGYRKPSQEVSDESLHTCEFIFRQLHRCIARLNTPAD